jgi:hypothetical protein
MQRRLGFVSNANNFLIFIALANNTRSQPQI